MSNKRSKYSADFKKDAVRLSNEPGRTAVEVAAGLGIPCEYIYKWRKELNENGALAFPGNGIEALTPEQKRIKELEKALRDTEMERDILKKAVGIFSRMPK